MAERMGADNGRKQSSKEVSGIWRSEVQLGCATTDDATTNECYNEQFLSIKSGCYNADATTNAEEYYRPM